MLDRSYLPIIIAAMTIPNRGTTALSMAPATAAANKGTVGWSDVAINAAKNFAVTEREKLRKEGLLNVQRPVHIRAERLDINRPEQWMSNGQEDSSKVIHFQRHGQGYHNLIGDVYRQMGFKVNMTSTDPMENPFVRPEILDSPLTESGRQTSASFRPQAALLNPEVVVVSPLLRTLQTADVTFKDHIGRIPFVAHELCREELGVHVCNKRRPISETKDSFPYVNFDLIESDEDIYWSPDKHESNADKADRAYAFLADFVRNRPEKEMAVVGHSAWLFTMCNAVMDCKEDEELTKWFLTSEVRSMRVTFTDESEFQ